MQSLHTSIHCGDTCHVATSQQAGDADESSSELHATKKTIYKKAWECTKVFDEFGQGTEP
jgi:hypothetical protein